jgi:hypothetical protein
MMVVESVGFFQNLFENNILPYQLLPSQHSPVLDSPVLYYHSHQVYEYTYFVSSFKPLTQLSNRRHQRRAWSGSWWHWWHWGCCLCGGRLWNAACIYFVKIDIHITDALGTAAAY